MKHFKFLLVALPVIIALLFTVSAFADSAHFLTTSAALDTSGNLVVSFKEAGLGTTLTSANMTANATSTAVYACMNGGDNHPQAANKETVSGPVSNSGVFLVRNGQTTGSITLSPIGPGNFACPNGQNLVLSAVSYSDVTVTDTTESDSTTVAGTFSNVLVAIS